MAPLEIDVLGGQGQHLPATHGGFQAKNDGGLKVGAFIGAGGAQECFFLRQREAAVALVEVLGAAQPINRLVPVVA